MPAAQRRYLLGQRRKLPTSCRRKRSDSSAPAAIMACAEQRSWQHWRRHAPAAATACLSPRGAPASLHRRRRRRWRLSSRLHGSLCGKRSARLHALRKAWRKAEEPSWQQASAAPAVALFSTTKLSVAAACTSRRAIITHLCHSLPQRQSRRLRSGVAACLRMAASSLCGIFYVAHSNVGNGRRNGGIAVGAAKNGERRKRGGKWRWWRAVTGGRGGEGVTGGGREGMASARHIIIVAMICSRRR